MKSSALRLRCVWFEVKGGRFDLKNTKMMFYEQINPNNLKINATRISKISKNCRKKWKFTKTYEIKYENQGGVIRERFKLKLV